MSNVNQSSDPIIRRRTVPSRRRRDGLIQYARDNTSQNGEDGIIEKIFSCLPPSESRFCVDIGAWDGRHLSNTYSLLIDNDQVWKGLLVEADPERFKELDELHTPRGNVCVNAAVSIAQGSPNQLQAIIQENAPDCKPDFDFLCVDIDGSDYWVLAALFEGKKYCPKVICVEFNPTMPDDLIFIPAKSDTIRHGASLAAFVELASQWGYNLVETTLFNAFFVRDNVYEDNLKTLVPDTSIEALHEISMGTTLYQVKWVCTCVLTQML
jgi:hypothetical protein